MTTDRRHGQDTPFGSWLRSNRGLDSISFSIVVMDVDWLIHRYKTHIGKLNRQERTVQCSMLIEEKAYNAEPSDYQKEVLFFHHQILKGHRRLLRLRGDKVFVRHFGAFVLSVEDDRPKDGTKMRWGVFTPTGQLNWFNIDSEKTLTELLRFDRHPKDPTKPFSVRSHHASKQVEYETTSELGFPIVETKTIRS
jgi:hypothetical protein